MNQLLDVALLEDWRPIFLQHDRVFVGYSGGLDSTALLHALKALPCLSNKLCAIHVHHGLSPNADDWVRHCQHFCKTFDVPLIVRHLELDIESNIEETLRIARYQVFSDELESNDCLVIAHHDDDQAETLLLQLFRGTGIDGMAAMSCQSLTSHQGQLYRPFLGLTRSDLEVYVAFHRLKYIQDESNLNPEFLRNYLRHQVIPLLKTKWPGVVGNLIKTASHCYEAKMNLEALADLDCIGLNTFSTQFPYASLKRLPSIRLKNVLRLWLKHNQVKCPSQVQLQCLLVDVIDAPDDKSPMIQWGDVVIRRFQQTLFLIKNPQIFSSASIKWSHFPLPIKLPSGSYLQAVLCDEGQYVPEGADITVHFRKGGERFFWRGQTKKLKKLMQEWQIPPWQRDSIPLIYINGEFASVVGFAISDRFYNTSTHDLVYRFEIQSLEGFS